MNDNAAVAPVGRADRHAAVRSASRRIVSAFCIGPRASTACLLPVNRAAARGFGEVAFKFASRRRNNEMIGMEYECSPRFARDLTSFHSGCRASALLVVVRLGVRGAVGVASRDQPVVSPAPRVKMNRVAQRGRPASATASADRVRRRFSPMIRGVIDRTADTVPTASDDEISQIRLSLVPSGD